MKDILVIHPADETTDCLKAIYENRDDCDVITDVFTDDETIREQIILHPKIVLLGHGTPSGLLCGNGVHRFARYIVDETHAPLFYDKTTFSIWCYSSLYFSKYVKGQGAKGFHSGMIISEVGEEYAMLGKAFLTESEMEANMKLFCEAFGRNFDLDHPDRMRTKVLKEYKGDDEVTKFNRERILVL